MPEKDFLIAPSILSADFAKLGAEVDASTGARRGGPRLELYDLSGDLSESSDMAATSQELVAMLAERLSKELERRGASMSLALPDRVPVPLPRALAPLQGR